MAEMTEDSFAARLFALRCELGEGARKPLSLKAFDDMIVAASGRRIHPTELSLMEQGERIPRLIDVEAIAAVDPKKRGPAWLAWGELPQAEDEADEAVEPTPRETPELATDDEARRREVEYLPPQPARRKA